jgi:putative membrane protein
VIAIDGAFRTAVEDAVRRLEARSAAEVVVVAAERSGSYRDVALGAGAAVAWIALAILVLSPVGFSALWTLVESAALFGMTSWLTHRTPSLLARLVTASRKNRQCLQAARAAYVEEAVDRTRDRTGVLVYLSRLERRVTVLPDAGVLGRVPAGKLLSVRWGDGPDPEDASSLDAFLAGLDALGAVLAEGIPSGDDNPNERPDAPRIRT